MARIRLDRDMPDGGGFAQTPMADEQTKAAGMRAATAAIPAAQKAIAKTPDELLLDRAQTMLSEKKAQLEALEIADPSLMVKGKNETNAQFMARKTAAYKAAPQPTLTEEEKAAGYIVKFVRTGAAGEGEYRKIAPLNAGNLQGSKNLDNEISETIDNGDGTITTVYKSGRRVTEKGYNPSSTNNKNVSATLVSTETDDYGNVIGFYSDGTQKTLITSGNKYKSTVDVDAYTLLESTFKDFGLEELVPDIKRFMEEGLGSKQAAVELRKTTAYINRFRGNEIRRQAGLNVVSEAAYLELENDYNETLRAYGLQGYFGVDRKVAQSKMADIIGNDISADEFNNRIETVVTRVNNAEPTIKNTLRAFYNITDTDLVGYFLNPKESLPKLQEKVLSAEIGSEAIRQNLLTDVTGATALAQLGITKEDARRGYQGIAEALPTAQKLGQIYGEEGINYTQATAEQEVFGQLESAKRKRMKLAEKEIGSFSGSSGLARGALGTRDSGAF